jgi:CRP-like cAMP-binding protein
MLDQGDLLSGMGMLFIKDFMDLAIKTSYGKGDFLFHEGDPAEYFYTLILGKIDLSIRKARQNVYTVCNPGEVFGWSSIVGRETYSASAEVLEPSTLLKIDKDKFMKLMDEHPNCAIIFFKNLSKTLGNRLLKSYSLIASSPIEAV